jgi:hypothetical protein
MPNTKPNTKPNVPPDNNNNSKQTIVIITSIASICTCITTIIGMITIGVKLNDRMYASKDDIAKLELQLRTVDAKLNFMLGSYTQPQANAARRQIPR